jgi:hypothetical protein
LGFGLDSVLRGHWGRDDLAMSPARAARYRAPAPYHDKLLPLPGFCGATAGHKPDRSPRGVAGLALTGYFLTFMLLPHGGNCLRRASLRPIAAPQPAGTIDI